MGDKFATEAFTLLALAIVIIILRTVARWITTGLRNFQLDDYLMPLAAVSEDCRICGRQLIEAGCVWVGDRRRVLRRRLVERIGEQCHDR